MNAPLKKLSELTGVAFDGVGLLRKGRRRSYVVENRFRSGCYLYLVRK